MAQQNARRNQVKGKWHDNARQRKAAQPPASAKRLTARTHDNVKTKPGTGQK